MPQIPIIMPQLGESIAEATIVRLLVKPGDEIEADQDIFEVETNKATMNVSIVKLASFWRWRPSADNLTWRGLVVPPDVPSPSQYDAPLPMRLWLLPLKLTLAVLKVMRGPADVVTAAA